MRYYRIYLSSKVDVEIDEEDYQKLTEKIANGNLIKLKQAIINPSFIVCIVPFDKKPRQILKGYIDEESKTFRITDQEVVRNLPDGFANDIKQLAEAKRV